MTHLHWLPEDPLFRDRLKAFRSGSTAGREDAWTEAVALANTRLDFTRTNMLDQAVRTLFGDAPPGSAKRIRLAMLGSCTMAHLHAAIRVAGVRRGFWIDVYENDYGQYRQDLSDGGSALQAFRPDTVLLALDAHHLAAGASAQFQTAEADAAIEEQLAGLVECWRLARSAFPCAVMQQTPLPVHPALLGSNEHRLPGSPASVIARINERLRPMADAAGVDLLAVDTRAAQDGLAAWHDAALWHRAKQEIAPTAAPLFGDMVGRLLAARRGRSFKGLVLDLDNTLWGGVIGDDGMEGIVLGQGSSLGEGYAAFQTYARNLSRRGIILAVCSKNDEAIALEPFETHPEMVLKRGRHRELPRQLERQGRQYQGHCHSVEHRSRQPRLRRRQPGRTRAGAAGAADGGGAGGVGRSRRLRRGAFGRRLFRERRPHRGRPGAVRPVPGETARARP